MTNDNFSKKNFQNTKKSTKKNIILSKPTASDRVRPRPTASDRVRPRPTASDRVRPRSTASQNSTLHQAKKNKNDEFHTQSTDIEKELVNYQDQFKGKVVYCNCDDPKVSNFFLYFVRNFKELGLKKLVTSCYKNQNVGLFSKHDSEQASYLEYKGGKVKGSNMPDLKTIGVKDFKGDGDFRNKESIKLLKKADIVATNPPFSLFREYVEQLIEYDKKFVIVGDQNAITYKEIFKLIKEDRIWLGYDNGGTKWFQVPDSYDIKTESRKKIEKGIKYFSKGSIVWFTNLDTTKRHEDLLLYKKYTPEEYPKYDNYDAINVNEVAKIPMDYKGAMGVPITFMDKYNPDQFEILSSNDIRTNEKTPFKQHGLIKDKDGSVNGTPKYVRIVIRNKRL